MLNSVMLKGNLAQQPYFDRIEGSGVPFLRFYLAVSLPEGIATTVLKGNVTQPPYFDRVGNDQRPFMRLYLAVNRLVGDRADFVRVVSYDDCALFSYPYLQPGSEVLASGNLRARRRRVAGGKQETVIELVADDLTFIRKIDWERGDAERERLLAERGDEPDGEPNNQTEEGGGFFRVVAFGNLALLSYAYLQQGSEVFVQGTVQSRKRNLPDGKKSRVVEVVARRIRFLRGVNWEDGDRARYRIIAERDNKDGK